MGHAEVAERQTRYVQDVVPFMGVWVQIPPSAPTFYIAAIS